MNSFFSSNSYIAKGVAVIQVYIHFHRNVEVDIVFDPRDEYQLQLFNIAYKKASKFFEEANIKIKKAENETRRARGTWRRYN